MRLLYTGPSLLDGAPIFVAATDESDNRKTGPMVQVWIMRADVHPLQAVRTISLVPPLAWRVVRDEHADAHQQLE